jgi:hypothetical protein
MGAATFTPGPTVAVAGDNRAPGTSSQGVLASGERYVEGSMTFSASYATGGETLAITNLPFKTLLRMELICDNNNTNGLSLSLRGLPATPKVFLSGAATGVSAEIAAATALNTRAPVRVRLIGR